MLDGKYKIFIVFICILLPVFAKAEVLQLDDALRATYTACIGIDDELSDLKKMAGINTAVTAVGTAAGAGATVVGLVKENKDTKAEELEKLIKELHELEDGQNEPTEEELEAFLNEFEISYEDAIENLATNEDKLKTLNKQSKNLGKWRTGLMIGNTATNVAGAIIAKNNNVDDDLQIQIDNCKKAVDELQKSIMQARIDGEDVTEAQEIANACKEYNYVDISPINKRGKGTMISSVIGATTGLAGSVTSAMANTDKTRNDNTDAGAQKEKNLNTASNVLAGTSTVASATATVFNATQISAIKKVAAVAEKCTEVLK